jgi:hypothetical protein
MGIAAVKLSAEGAGKLPCVTSPLIFMLVLPCQWSCASELTLSIWSAMTTLYQFKLGLDVHIIQGQLLTCTPAYLALASVMSMVRDIARARLPKSGLVTFPGIISLYTVAMAALKLSHLYPDSTSVVNDILDTLRILGRRSKLAGEIAPLLCSISSAQLEYSVLFETTRRHYFRVASCGQILNGNQRHEIRNFRTQRLSI